MRIAHGTFLFLLFLLPLASFSLPSQIRSSGERIIIVDPANYQWGAYDTNGYMIRSGQASAGKDFCEDTGKECRTKPGYYRIRSLGGSHCKSPSFPLPHGGAPMPYCMYYTRYQALHGSPQVGPGNISHGCVRMHVSDARWLRYNFARLGTLVVILPY